jgi:hypothetical protein
MEKPCLDNPKKLAKDKKLKELIEKMALKANPFFKALHDNKKERKNMLLLEAVEAKTENAGGLPIPI